MLSLSDTPGAGSSGEVHAIELSRPVESLASGVSRSITPLYNIHNLLQQLSGDGTKRLRRFVGAKQALGREWEGWLMFFRRCMGYSRNYVALCSSLQSGIGGMVGHMATAGSLLSTAREISRDTKRLVSGYEGVVDEFAALPYPFGRPSHFHEHHQSPPNDSLYALPGIHQPFTEAVSALLETTTALRDISIFWDHHMKEIADVASATHDIHDLLRSGYFAKQMGDWVGFHDCIRKALSDITSYCDALTVTPVNSVSIWWKIRLFMSSKRFHRTAFPSPSPSPPPMLEANNNNNNNNNSTATLVAPDADREWRAGFEVLLSSNPYDIANFVDSTLDAQGHLQTLSGAVFSSPISSDQYPAGRSPSDLAEWFKRSLGRIHRIASDCAGFYQLAQMLVYEDQIGETSQKMIKLANDSEGNIKGLLSEFHNMHDALSQMMSALKTGGDTHSAPSEARRRDRELKILQKAADTLLRLFRALVSLGDRLNDLIAGAEYIRLHGLETPHDHELEAIARSWNKQERRFKRFANAISDSERRGGLRVVGELHARVWLLAFGLRGYMLRRWSEYWYWDRSAGRHR